MTPSRSAGSLWPLAFLLAGCFPTTTRPAFLPEPTAPSFEIALTVPKATLALALALDGDSIPVNRTEAKDGWLETGWFDPSTRRPTKRRMLGPDVVKLRAFIDPGRPNHSEMTIEVVYRPVADPSRSDRQLERELPATHPFVAQMVDLATKLVKQYGGTATDSVAPAVKKP